MRSNVGSHSTLLAISLALSLAPLNSRADFTQGDYYYTVTNNQATITGFNQNYSGSLSITNLLGGYPVTSIGGYSFYDCTRLTSVTIPDSVTTIGNSMFSYCIRLASVTIGPGVTSIGTFPFSDCKVLTNIFVSADNPAYASADGALFNKNFTVLIKYPTGKTGSYSIPSNITTIISGAFTLCSGLTSLTIPDSVTSIGESSFSYCSGLPSITIPSSVTNIGNYAFYSCTGLTSVTIPTNVTSIGESSFSYCSSLTRLIIPDSVTTIGRSTFYYCFRLTSVTIPSSVTNIGNFAFYNCNSLTSVLFHGTPPNLGGSFAISSTHSTLYYLPAFAASWPSTFGGRPTLCWNPAVQQDASFGFTPGRFGFSIVGTTNIPIVVQATTNLVSGVWASLTNTNLGTSGSFHFIDQNSTNQPSRFYRIVWP